jgi:hypothetical protein
MTFTRSKSGLANYPSFVDSELIIYIEGSIEEGETFDEIYYRALISKITNIKAIKVKPIGNKHDAIEYFNKIADLETNNSIVIIDKDLIGISSSILEHKKLFLTHGYSWENDFWSEKLCLEIINNITLGNSHAHNGSKKSYTLTLKRASKICALDSACQINGLSLIHKNNKSCGINLDAKGLSFISANEFKRHITNFRSKKISSCPITGQILAIAINKKPNEVVQGHLWEHIVTTIISRYYKEATKSKSAPLDMIKNIAFSRFKEDPLTYISTDCLTHYKDQFSRIGL